jgi:hypothetical protein
MKDRPMDAGPANSTAMTNSDAVARTAARRCRRPQETMPADIPFFLSVAIFNIATLHTGNLASSKTDYCGSMLPQYGDCINGRSIAKN